ncbi:MAG: hypothetical protein B0A82_26305 [Alkalinema sp. CACIAM 70d]|nr:MAG: hypothetical protein B0A82_26305 [Alkalinema sp. CACIAM 70d]
MLEPGLEPVLEQVKDIFAELGIADDVQEDTLLQSHLGLDSVETVRLALELKRRLGIEVKLGSRQDVTVGTLCRMATISTSGVQSGVQSGSQAES